MEKTIRGFISGKNFLVWRTRTDWTHTGFATAFDEKSFVTIEGNTNDEGSREGLKSIPDHADITKRISSFFEIIPLRQALIYGIMDNEPCI